MRDDNDRIGNRSSSGELLNELDSIKELLDEELKQNRAAPATSIEEIGSVEEYLRIKQEADHAGLSMEAYLAQQESAEELEKPADDDEEGLPLLDEVVTLDEEETENGNAPLREAAEVGEQPPSTAAATTVEEYFAAVAAAKHRQSPSSPATPEQAAPTPTAAADAAIPVLDEVVSGEETIPLLAESAPEGAEEGMSLEDMQELVDLLVNRKLEQLKPALEKEVMAELQRLLPHSALPKG